MKHEDAKIVAYDEGLLQIGLLAGRPNMPIGEAKRWLRGHGTLGTRVASMLGKASSTLVLAAHPGAK